MTGRIGRAFEIAGRERRGALIPYLTSGFPDPALSDRLLDALCAEGADAVELGVPFSDPLADGPVIQRASEAALEAGATLEGALAQAARLRARHEIPIVLMTYLNPVLRLGADRFATAARAAGVDGVILVDLPPEEEPGVWEALRAAALDAIVLIAPTTQPDRLPRLVRRASGYVYVVARLGVTGRGEGDAASVRLLARCREVSPLPRCVGFGIDLASDLDRFRGMAEGVIVGSALLEAIMAERNPTAREGCVREFVRSFRAKLGALAPT